MKELGIYKKHIRNKRLLTFCLHDVIYLISIRYRIDTVSGGYALAVRDGGNLNHAIIQLIKEFPILTHHQASEIIIYHRKFGR
ncbi:hypothetical protein [Photobacterium toruni]|uniref:Uncharacterized protein n=1 Tax=Photobacterium toruni TaxID=1935446 RepID=A0A1T4UJD1_9GAMM|nr:hypothetical protein [Photobacterium toruni]SKA52892.1 hypothetical protein CZ814_03363 [Photobacterium toruni]